MPGGISADTSVSFALTQLYLAAPSAPTRPTAILLLRAWTHLLRLGCDSLHVIIDCSCRAVGAGGFCRRHHHHHRHRNISRCAHASSFFAKRRGRQEQLPSVRKPKPLPSGNLGPRVWRPQFSSILLPPKRKENKIILKGHC